MALRVPPVLLTPLHGLMRRHVLNPELGFASQRARADRVLGLATRPPTGTVVEPVSLGGVEGIGVLARGADRRRRVVHLHGGGYCLGSPTMAIAFAAAVSASAGCQVLLPDYRLAPEHPFPAALDDALAVWRALAADGGTRPALMGDSAGAGLAVATSLALLDVGEPPPAALVLVSPFLDLTRRPERDRHDRVLTPEWLWLCAQAYAREHDPRDPLVSPVYAAPEALAALPPTRVVTATYDTLAPQAARFVEQARAAGAAVEHHVEQGLWHDFPLQAGTVRAADAAAERIGTFLAPAWPHPDR